MDKRNDKIPDIRFPKFKEGWEHIELNELLQVSKKKNKDLKYSKEEVLSVSREFGIVNQIKHLGRSYAGVSVHNYGVVETGDIVYTKSPLKSNPYGIIKLNTGETGIVSTLYAVYKTKLENANAEFIQHYFSLNANTNRYLRPLVRKGAKNDMKINNEYVLNDRIFAPKKSEQVKIASFLTTIKKRIENLEKNKDLLEQYLKGVMQKIFKQQIRFKDDEGKDFPTWESNRLSTYLTVSKRKNSDSKFNKNDVMSVSGKLGVVNQIKHMGRSYAGVSVRNYGIVEHGDIVYTKSPLKMNPYGIIKLNKNETGIVSTLYAIYTINKDKAHGEFIDYYFQLTDNTNKYLRPLVRKGAKNDMKINKEYVLHDHVCFPSKKEQIVISKFISSIDAKISLIDIQLKKTKSYQKVLLQRMFCY